MFKPVDHLYVNPVATSTAVNLPVNHINDTSAVFGTPVMCRRQKGFYFLLTLFILGVIILVFIAVSSVIIYITHPCASLDCFYGAECIVDSNGKEARCQCENYCQSDPRSSETVCGSNGIPYPSECHLRVASCSIQTNIYVKSKGSCDNKGLESSKSVSLSGSEEGKTRSPVASGQLCNGQHCAFGSMCTNGSSAGSAGPGYQCLCPDNCQDYGQVKQYLQSVLRYPGLLGDSSRSSGPQSHGEPLCGTDGRDYGSVCQLAKVSCEETREIQVKFKGKCDPCSGIRCPGNQLCGLDDNRNPVCRCNEHKCPSNGPPQSGPVCGSDGRTYTNECQLQDTACRKLKNIRIISHGECKEGNHPCLRLNCSQPMECNVDKYGVASCRCPGDSCPKIYRPVCGSDGHTHDSLCHLERKSCLSRTSVTLLHIGTCDKTLGGLSSSSLATGPVCSVDTCHFGGTCTSDEASGQLKCICSSCFHSNNNVPEPVCGTDHVSYNSDCELRRASCEQQKPVQVAYAGPCRGCEELQCKHYAVCEINGHGISECICPQVCIRVDAPVCGSDGQTYENECELRVRSCRLQIKLTVKSVGPCDSCQSVRCKPGASCEEGFCVCPTHCPSGIKEPICANDGTTYPNECELRRVACINEMDLRPLFYGECDDAEESPGYRDGYHHDAGSGDSDEQHTKFPAICCR